MEFDTLIDDAPADFHSGEIALWAAVLTDAVFTLRDGGGNQDRARGWIEDPANIFFDAVADEIGFSPEGLRERIGEVVKRSGEDRRKSWQGRVRVKLWKSDR